MISSLLFLGSEENSLLCLLVKMSNHCSPVKLHDFFLSHTENMKGRMELSFPDLCLELFHAFPLQSWAEQQWEEQVYRVSTLSSVSNHTKSLSQVIVRAGARWG